MKRLLLFCAFVQSTYGATLLVNTGTPDGLIATASRPSGGGKIEIETADDFITTASVTNVTGGSFYGLLTTTNAGPATISSIDVEIYRVFPLDSNSVRTITVPTRVNSPSDVALDSRSSTASEVAFTVTTLSASFTAANSVLNGIHPLPNTFTGGEGSITGKEVRIDFTLPSSFSLPANHYFFVAQVGVSGGEFYWLSAPRPISGAGTTPFAPDLQSWIRDQNLDPDWLRIGTDITHQGPFNAAFALVGTEVPEPATLFLVIMGLGAAALVRSRRCS